MSFMLPQFLSNHDKFLLKIFDDQSFLNINKALIGLIKYIKQSILYDGELI